MKKLVILSVLCMLFSGCASTTKMTEKSHQKMSKIYVNKDVKIPKSAYYYGPEQGAGAVFGVIGALVAEGAETNDELIVNYMRENGIDIGEICKTAVEDFIFTNSKLSPKQFVTNAKDADTYLTVEVYIYGIAQTSGFSSVYRPQLGIKAKLTDRNNTIIWEDYDFITPMNDGVEAIEFDEYFKDPSNMKIRYEKAAEIVVSFMSKNL